MVMYHKFKPNEETLSLAHTYLRYIEGIQRPNGWFDYKDYDNELTRKIMKSISKMLMEELYGAWGRP
jgi:hypothetical protein